MSHEGHFEIFRQYEILQNFLEAPLSTKETPQIDDGFDTLPFCYSIHQKLRKEIIFILEVVTFTHGRLKN